MYNYYGTKKGQYKNNPSNYNQSSKGNFLIKGALQL